MTVENDDSPKRFSSIRYLTLLMKYRQIFFHNYANQRLAILDIIKDCILLPFFSVYCIECFLSSSCSFISHPALSNLAWPLYMLWSPWASAEIFPGGGKVNILLILFQVVGDATQMDVDKKENAHCYVNNCIQCFPCKKTLQWANVCFSEHGYFKTELAEFWLNYKLCEFLKEV